MSDPESEKDLREIKGMLRDLSGSLEEVKRRSDQVYYAVAGNDLDKSQGISERLKKAEGEIKNMSEQINRAKWTATGVAIGAGTAGGGIVSFLFKILSN